MKENEPKVHTIEEVTKDILTRQSKGVSKNNEKVISALIVETMISTWKQKGKEKHSEKHKVEKSTPMKTTHTSPLVQQMYLEDNVSTDSEETMNVNESTNNTSEIESSSIPRSHYIKTIHKLSKQIDRNNALTSCDSSSQRHMKTSSSLEKVMPNKTTSQHENFKSETKMKKILSNPDMCKYFTDIIKKHRRSKNWAELMKCKNQETPLHSV